MREVTVAAIQMQCSKNVNENIEKAKEFVKNMVNRIEDYYDDNYMLKEIDDVQ